MSQPDEQATLFLKSGLTIPSTLISGTDEKFVPSAIRRRVAHAGAGNGGDENHLLPAR
jgi:hypothetical protein